MPITDDMIQHPDRPDEYLRAEKLIINNDDRSPSLDICCASRYIDDDSVAQSDAGNEVVTLDREDPDHMALYLAARKVSLKALAARRDKIQAARDARQQKGNA
jgi:hypothetical protein